MPFSELPRLDDIRKKRPLLHCISNLVTANDCANLALAMGASPMMAEAPEEMAEIERLSDATVLNCGTPSAQKYAACLISGREAARLGKPVVLDPVGVGASAWRLENAGRLLAEFTPSILRVNYAEARALIGFAGGEQGVDSPANPDLAGRIGTAKALAKRLRCTVLLTGAEDIVTDGARGWYVTGGSALMPLVTGTGCMLSVVCAAFASVEPGTADAAAMASVFWKTCSELAQRDAGGNGPGSFRAALMDRAWKMTPREPEYEGRALPI